MLYNASHQRGFLLDALNYSAKKKRKATKPLEELFDKDEVLTDEEKDAILKYFKRCVLPKDQKEVEQKMKDTKAFRRDLILNNIEKYQDCWQFYFVSPELVGYFKFIFCIEIENNFLPINFS